LFSSSCATLPGCAHRSWRRRGRPPSRVVRRRRLMTAGTSALVLSCAPPASPLCFQHSKPCPVTRIRATSSELCRAPQLARLQVTTAARSRSCSVDRFRVESTAPHTGHPSPCLALFVEKSLSFIDSQVYPSVVQRSSRLGPFFYVLNPSLSSFSTRGPALVFLHRSP
jgi:hypothetical protein